MRLLGELFLYNLAFELFDRLVEVSELRDFLSFCRLFGTDPLPTLTKLGPPFFKAMRKELSQAEDFTVLG